MRLWKSPTLQTLAAIFVVFVAQFAGKAVAGVGSEFFALALPLAQNPWTVVLSVYSHAGFGHLFANAVALLLFGLIVEEMTTAARYHAFFVVTGVLAGVVQTFAGVAMGEPTAVLGASGAIFALMGYVIVGNFAVVSLLDSVEVDWKVTVGVGLLLAVGLTMFTASPGVALIAHFTGLSIGLLAGRFRLLHP